ncbi:MULTISPECIES: hypothetical protein [Calothrix]|uniref:Uncharacterized protein n=2 Tax=Calothrix TaxID=1186 RepID=A0ABR8ANG1_9CYAN|nr:MULTISPECIES: hypothetical protein [Calothrix]MBD2200167.1 hypothetical protein [Calothrix parietina FACHB-288]MBD2229123.1 hypothetical protein [Calothrix anomala FACHB-343]
MDNITKYTAALIISQPDKKDIKAKLISLWQRYVMRDKGYRYTHTALWFDGVYYESTFNGYFVKEADQVILPRLLQTDDFIYYFHPSKDMVDGFYERLAEFENKKLEWKEFYRIALGLGNKEPVCTQFIARLCNLNIQLEGSIMPLITPLNLLKYVMSSYQFGRLYISNSRELDEFILLV